MRELTRAEMTSVAGGHGVTIVNRGGDGGSAIQLNAPIGGAGGPGILATGGAGGNAQAQSQKFGVNGGDGGSGLSLHF